MGESPAGGGGMPWDGVGLWELILARGGQRWTFPGFIPEGVHVAEGRSKIQLYTSHLLQWGDPGCGPPIKFGVPRGCGNSDRKEGQVPPGVSFRAWPWLPGTPPFQLGFRRSPAGLAATKHLHLVLFLFGVCFPALPRHKRAFVASKGALPDTGWGFHSTSVRTAVLGTWGTQRCHGGPGRG